MSTSFWSLLKEYKVVIPIIQRDYAQGRNTGKIPLIRKNILDAIFTNISTETETLQLDFIYGYTNSINLNNNSSNKTFYPLDGQQRLTTLFLLYWYIAVKEGHHDLAKKVLSNFTYETRHSSEVFCSELTKYKPENLNMSIKENIINQPWFFTAWNNDPTVSSMLVMLDSIQEKADEYKIGSVWERLISENPSITFHLLDMDELGLPDELYIKMNSRGKELTDFEYFKGKLSEIIPSGYSDDFNHSIDSQWTDLFWDLYEEDIDKAKEDKTFDIAQKLDAGFLRFFRYITDMIIYKNEIQDLDTLEELEVFKNIYSQEKNIEYVFKVFDRFIEHKEERPRFYDEIFYIESSSFSPEKTRMFFDRTNINLFKKCADSYDPKQRNNPFSLGEQLLFYGCIVHILEDTNDFNYRIRKLRNLISNSEDTVRNENISSLLKSVEDIIINNKLDKNSKFISTQIREEDAKTIFLTNNPEMVNTIRKVEDHDLLRGCISIFDMTKELKTYVPIFEDIFTEKSDYDLMSRAMLVKGRYIQEFGRRSFLGNKKDITWRELFTPTSRRTGFDNTKKVLKQLLDTVKENPEITLENIVNKYLERFTKDPLKEKNWEYYFIKYLAFRRHEDGYYYWPDQSKPYECIMLRRKTIGGFHWDPFLVALRWSRVNLLTLDNYGAPLIYSNGNATIKINTFNDCYKLEAIDEIGEELLQLSANSDIISNDYKLMISQSENSLDIEDRVQKGIAMIDRITELCLANNK